MVSPITNVVGFDDAPFKPADRGDVRIFGAICARMRLDGLVSGVVRRDGVNATKRMGELFVQSQFKRSVRAVLLRGIAAAGFSVVAIETLASELCAPVVVVARRTPRLALLRAALAPRRECSARSRAIRASRCHLRGAAAARLFSAQLRRGCGGAVGGRGARQAQTHTGSVRFSIRKLDASPMRFDD
jgi:endonuclease V-like protein UPF0215 family